MKRSNRSIDYQYVPRAVAVLIDEFPAKAVMAEHRHRRSQLIFASAGVMSVITAEGSYVVPPHRALWIPGGVSHEVHTRTAVSLRTLYIDKHARPDLPTTCRVIAVPNLLRELILSAVDIPIEYALEGRDGKIMDLILEEICAIPSARLHVPMPKSARLRRICVGILDDPARKDCIDQLASSAGCSRRTFTRLFREETGMSFAAWRQHVRLLEAISRMAAGASVSSAAYAVGYGSQSAFSAMFQREFRATPTEYLALYR